MYVTIHDLTTMEHHCNLALLGANVVSLAVIAYTRN